MKRSPLAWALSAVLPHVGRNELTAVVGLEQHNGHVYAYATDRYTIGIARVPSLAQLDLRFTPKEATELMRFVRPTRVAEHEQELSIALRDDEFHVGLTDEDGELFDSAVFNTTEHALSLNYLLELVTALNDQPVEWDELIYQAPMVSKFAKAQRAETDRLRILPRRGDAQHGAAIVTVGADFIGTIGGLSYDDSGAATVADFLQNAERKAA